MRRVRVHGKKEQGRRHYPRRERSTVTRPGESAWAGADAQRRRACASARPADRGPRFGGRGGGGRVGGGGEGGGGVGGGKGGEGGGPGGDRGVLSRAFLRGGGGGGAKNTKKPP